MNEKYKNIQKFRRTFLRNFYFIVTVFSFFVLCAFVSGLTVGYVENIYLPLFYFGSQEGVNLLLICMQQKLLAVSLKF